MSDAEIKRIGKALRKVRHYCEEDPSGPNHTRSRS